VTRGIYRGEEDGVGGAVLSQLRRQLHTSQQLGMVTGETSGGSGGGSQSKPIVPVAEKLVSSSSSSPASPPLPAAPPPQRSINSSNQPPLIPGPPKREKKVTNFLFKKFFAFVQGYQDMMEKKFPDAMKVYRVFILGVKVKLTN